MTGSAALGLAVGLLALGLALWHTQVIIAIAALLVAALIPGRAAGVAVYAAARRAVAFRADHEGITLGAVPGKLTRRGAVLFVPWADVEQIVLYPAYPGGRGRYAQARCIGIRRRDGAPALPEGNEQARPARYRASRLARPARSPAGGSTASAWPPSPRPWHRASPLSTPIPPPARVLTDPTSQ